MAEFEVTTQPLAIDFGATGVTEIYQNLRMILTTPEFSCPLDRGFSWNPEIDLPANVAQGKMSTRIAAAIRQYEQRVELISVSFQADLLNGKLNPSIKVRVKEGVTL